MIRYALSCFPAVVSHGEGAGERRQVLVKHLDLPQLVVVEMHALAVRPLVRGDWSGGRTVGRPAALERGALWLGPQLYWRRTSIGGNRYGRWNDYSGRGGGG